MPGPLLGAVSGQMRQPGLGLLRVERDGARRRARGDLGPFGQLRKQPALGGCRFRQPIRHHRCPGPAQPEQRLRSGPRPFALGPVGLGHVEQLFGGAAQEGGDLGVGRGCLQPGFPSKAARRRHHEARRAEESEQLQHIEPRQIGITQPLPDQRRVEHDHRCIRRDPDRFAPPDRPRALGIGDPDAAMAGMQRGMGEQGHAIPSREWNEMATATRRIAPRAPTLSLPRRRPGPVGKA